MIGPNGIATSDGSIRGLTAEMRRAERRAETAAREAAATPTRPSAQAVSATLRKAAHQRASAYRPFGREVPGFDVVRAGNALNWREYDHVNVYSCWDHRWAQREHAAAYAETLRAAGYDVTERDTSLEVRKAVRS